MTETTQPHSTRNVQTQGGPRRVHYNSLAQDLYKIPENIKSIFRDSQNDQPFKVLQHAHKDIIMNHDMFLVEKVPKDDSKIASAAQISSFVHSALAKVMEERKWTRNEIDIDAQMHEASFIYRRVLQTIGQPQSPLELKQLQQALTLLWTFLVMSFDVTLFKQEDLIREQNSKMKVLIHE